MRDRLVRHRDAESRLFGHAIAAVELETADDVVHAVREATHDGVDLLVLRVADHATAALEALRGVGAEPCDSLITYGCDVSAAEAPQPPHEWTMAEVDGPHGADAIAALARDAFTDFVGHWHRDARIERTLATELYAAWAADLWRAASPERPLLTARDADGRLAGFLGLAPLGEGIWTVPLAGVAPAARGRGLLGGLIVESLRRLRLRQQVSLRYETQTDNRAARRSVEKLGFRAVGTRHTFHLWLPHP